MMNSRLESNAYGKNAIRLSRIIRHPGKHEIRQIAVNVSLQGDFDAAHTEGDNSKILPTDTMKNTVYALAKHHFTASIEAFGLHLADHFLSRNPQVDQVCIDIEEYAWTRMQFDGVPHPHAFLNGGSEKHTASISLTRQEYRLISGIKDLLLLKTTDSGFEHYIRDEYTTLKETADRIFSTECEISWTYSLPTHLAGAPALTSPPHVTGSSALTSQPHATGSPNTHQPASATTTGASTTPPDYTRLYEDIRSNLLRTFADHKSLSVQHTLYAMGNNLLAAFDCISEVSLKMPNKHHIPFNLEQFGMQNNNEIFIATDEPYGYITGTVTRSTAP